MTELTDGDLSALLRRCVVASRDTRELRVELDDGSQVVIVAGWRSEVRAIHFTPDEVNRRAL